tara:strand:- start:4028 stop:4849 length:822 start_codon:yes stop_codon:yes gene_type:complete
MSSVSCASSQNLSTQTDFKVLFNGKDFTGWYTYQREPEPTSCVTGLKMEDDKYVEPIGLNRDPLGVFTVVKLDGESVIRISGETFGILVSDKEFENYHLSLEFKWGEKKYPPRENSKRDSGILYHSFGSEGSRGGVWMKSVECQIQEGDVGDLWCVDGTIAKVNVVKEENGKPKYDPSGSLQTFDSRGERYCPKSIDYEKPIGEWNRVDIYTYGDESIHLVNGQINMHVKGMKYFVDQKLKPLTKGKIQLQSEGSEVFYRNIRIKPISKMLDL